MMTENPGSDRELYLELEAAQKRIKVLEASVNALKECQPAEKVHKAIYKISQAAVSTNTLSELYLSIHKVLGEFMPVDNFYIALYDPATELLSFPYYVDQHDSPPTPQKLGHGLTEYVLRTVRPLLGSKEVFRRLIEQGEVELEGADSLAWLGVPLKLDGRIIGVMVTQNYTENVQYAQSDLDMLEFVSTQVAQAIARKADEEKLRQIAIRTQGLVEISAAIVQNGLDIKAVLDNISALVSKLLGDACFIHLISANGRWLKLQAVYCPDPCDSTFIRRLLASYPLRLGEGLAGRVADTGKPLLAAEVAMQDLPEIIRHEYQLYLEHFEIHSILIVPLRTQGQVLGTVSALRNSAGRPYSEDDEAFLQEVADRTALAINYARLFAQEQARSKDLSVLYSLTSSLRQTMLESDMLPIVYNQVFQLIEADSGMIELLNTDKTQFTIALGVGALAPNTGRVFRASEGVSGLVVRTDQPFVTRNYSAEPLRFANLYNVAVLGPAVFVPLDSDAEIQGILMIARSNKSQAGYFTDQEVQLLNAIAEIVGNSLRRAHLFEDSQRRLQQTQALRAIDTAISNSHDLQATLNIFLDQVVAQLKVDSVCVLLLNHTQELSFAAGRGFMTTSLQHTHLRLGEGYAGIAAKERRIISISDLRHRYTDFLRSPSFNAERFVTYFAIPLATESQVTGVMEIYHRTQLNPDSEWFEFAQTLAGQAAIAIDNASLFSELERSNIELMQAYEATIEGWSRALDLRDHETEGHTQRVTKITMLLAQAFGLDRDQINHIRRGALLHDIGKMGIPDYILLKPGPLSPEEREKMRKHPEYAHNLLASITYLKPAIDIPYYHHEKWDGTGYPRSLKGAEIPLAARIFSITDVWDALTSDRPYRSAWSRDETLEYIRSESGKHFDPEVVTAFLKIIDELGT
jgi:HD-GYP domain-containing protein (c-di-GMP phosphodiesterase class II)